MGDGRVALILDVLGIGQRSGVSARSHMNRRAASAARTAQADTEQQRLLLFRAGPLNASRFRFVGGTARGVPAAPIEHAGGAQVVQYRNRILPLVPLGTLLCPRSDGEAQVADPVQVIVFTMATAAWAWSWTRFWTLPKTRSRCGRRTGRNGLLGSAVVGKRVADFLDLDYVFAASAAAWSQGTAGTQGKTVLVADASAFVRAMMRNRLEMAGYRVLEAGSVEDSIRRLERQPADTVLAGPALLEGEQGLRAVLRQRTEWESLPVIAIGEVESNKGGRDTGNAPAATPEELLTVLSRTLEPAAAAARA